MSTDRQPTTVVAVLTYRRTSLLPPLLAELTAQAASVEPRAEVLVVDNDPDASAADVVLGWAKRGVRYVHEPRPGISAARNRALAEAGDADALVFFDDDEHPGPDWLATITAAWREWGCAAVAGPVGAQLAVPAEPWVLGTGVFDRPTRPTGTRVRGAGAGNLLLDVRREPKALHPEEVAVARRYFPEVEAETLEPLEGLIGFYTGLLHGLYNVFGTVRLHERRRIFGGADHTDNGVGALHGFAHVFVIQYVTLGYCQVGMFHRQLIRSPGQSFDLITRIEQHPGQGQARTTRNAK